MALTYSFSSDFDIVDGLTEAVIADENGGRSVDMSAVVHPVSFREAEVSDGRYTTSDVAVEFPVTDVTDSIHPQIGGLITIERNSWVIIDRVQKSVTGIWRCVCRRLVVRDELDTLITIQQATWQKNSHGIQQATWTDAYSNIRARIQRLQADHKTEARQRHVEAEYEIYCEKQIIVGQNHRVLGPDNTVYRVLGYRQPDSLNGLFTILAEEWS